MAITEITPPTASRRRSRPATSPASRRAASGRSCATAPTARAPTRRRRRRSGAEAERLGLAYAFVPVVSGQIDAGQRRRLPRRARAPAGAGARLLPLGGALPEPLDPRRALTGSWSSRAGRYLPEWKEGRSWTCVWLREFRRVGAARLRAADPRRPAARRGGAGLADPHARGFRAPAARPPQGRRGRRAAESEPRRPHPRGGTRRGVARRQALLRDDERAAAQAACAGGAATRSWRCSRRSRGRSTGSRCEPGFG